MPVSHTFVSAIPDDPTSAAAGEVLPSHWNAAHTAAIAISEITATGTPDVTSYLRGDGSWSLPPQPYGTTIGTVQIFGSTTGGINYFGGSDRFLYDGTNIITLGTGGAAASTFTITTGLPVSGSGVRLALSTIAPATTGSGGFISLTAAASGTGASAVGGAITATAGATNATSGTATGGAVTLTAGAGSAGVTTSAGGGVILTAGAGRGTATGTGGAVTLTSGAGLNAGAGGAITLNTAAPGATGTAGVIDLRINSTSRLLIDATGLVTASYAVKTTATTVALLPAAATVGAGTRSFVTNATVTTFASVVVGGGANGVPVYSDGTNWRIG